MNWPEVYTMRPELLAKSQAQAFLAIMNEAWKHAPPSVMKDRDARTYAKALQASDAGAGDAARMGAPCRQWKFPDGSAVLIAEGGDGMKIAPTIILAV